MNLGVKVKVVAGIICHRAEIFILWQPKLFKKIKVLKNYISIPSIIRNCRLSFHHSQLQLMTSKSSNFDRFTLNIENINSTMIIFFFSFIFTCSFVPTDYIDKSFLHNRVLEEHYNSFEVEYIFFVYHKSL